MMLPWWQLMLSYTAASALTSPKNLLFKLMLSYTAASALTSPKNLLFKLMLSYTAASALARQGLHNHNTAAGTREWLLAQDKANFVVV
jgi:uncharacterized membrane protein